MSHHYGEYWTEWSDLKPNPDADNNEDNLLIEVKSFLLSLEQTEKTANLLEKLEKEIKVHIRTLTDF